MPREKTNPFSSRGLEEFSRLNTELAKKREHISRKKGVPGDAVRFAYRNQKWVPILMRNDGAKEAPRAAEEKNPSSNEGRARDSNLAPAPVETKAVPERKFDRNEYVELENIHGAIGIIIALFCMTYGRTLCGILWACACCWWGALIMLRKGKIGCFHDTKSRIRVTIDVVSTGGKVDMD